MDIAALSMALSGAKLSQDIGLAMTKKAMEQAEQNGNAITELLQTTAVHPNLGHHVDLKA